MKLVVMVPWQGDAPGHVPWDEALPVGPCCFRATAALWECPKPWCHPCPQPCPCASSRPWGITGSPCSPVPAHPTRCPVPPPSPFHPILGIVTPFLSCSPPWEAGAGSQDLDSITFFAFSLIDGYISIVMDAETQKRWVLSLGVSVPLPPPGGAE